MTFCQKNYGMPENDLAVLKENQGGTGRHKCVICAYAHGVEDGRLNKNLSSLIGFELCKHGSQAPINRIEHIHENQTHEQGRHKCLICAYELGFNKSIENVKVGVVNDTRPKGILSKQKIKNRIAKTTKRDYLEEQRYKTVLGLMGEKLVVKYLTENRYKVVHMSLEDDSIGYDILAIKDGIKSFIEVKTTTQDLNLDFFISTNELEFMENHRNDYSIYRVYEYDFKTNNAEFCILNAADFKNKYTKDCVSYRVKKNV